MSGNLVDIPVFCVLIAILLIGSMEIFARAAGLGDFPLYQFGGAALYRFAPNQRGKFANKYRWQYDSFGMRSHTALQSMTGITLIVGDSVVDGGAKIDQEDTLCRRIAERTGKPTYPVACHGWSLANEISALEELPDWSEASCIVWVVNAGDVDFKNRPKSYHSFPDIPPIMLCLWLLMRFLRQRYNVFMTLHMRRAQIGSKDSQFVLQCMFAQVLNRYKGLLLIVRYPMRDGTAPPSDFCFELAAQVGNGDILELAKESTWTNDCYADLVHPNAHGISQLARCIANRIQNTPRPTTAIDA